MGLIPMLGQKTGDTGSIPTAVMNQGLHIIVSLSSCHDNYLETSIDKRDYHNCHELGKN